MLKTQITREELEALGEEIRRHFDLPIVERGLEYQQKGFVYNTEVRPDRSLVSKVQGSAVYDVKLDMDFLGLSECSCPYQGYCKHMAAVFFYVYSVYGRPDAFVKDWKQRQDQPRFVRSGSKLQRQTELLASAQPAVATLKESASPDEWRTHIEREFAAFGERHNRFKYETEEYYDAALQTAVRPSLWWGNGTKRLLALYALLHALQRLEHDFGSLGQAAAYRLPAYRAAAKALERKLEQTVDEIDVDDTMRRWPDHLRAIGPIVFESLGANPPQAIVGWLDIYRLLWSRLLRQPLWVEHEIEAVDQARLHALRRADGEPDRWAMARAHFAVMAGDDRDARQRLGVVESFHPTDALFYVRKFHRGGEWERLWEWLQWLLARCRNGDRDVFQTLCTFAGEAAAALGREEEWTRALAEMLPSSYYVYTEFLIRSGRFREWADYHLAERIAVFELYPADLRAVESQEPSAVLPLYHQTIERCILQKNRTAYKEAIRLIKKLAALYKQTGQTERCELYLRRLSQQYSRLRAFQEELTKGKLIR